MIFFNQLPVTKAERAAILKGPMENTVDIPVFQDIVLPAKISLLICHFQNKFFGVQALD